MLINSDVSEFEVLPPQESATRPSAHAHTLVAVQLSLRPFVRADSAETPKSVRPSITVAPYGAHEYDTIAHSIAAVITSGARWLRDNFVQTVLHAGTRALGNPESVLRSAAGALELVHQGVGMLGLFSNVRPGQGHLRGVCVIIDDTLSPVR